MMNYKKTTYIIASIIIVITIISILIIHIFNNTSETGEVKTEIKSEVETEIYYYGD